MTISDTIFEYVYHPNGEKAKTFKTKACIFFFVIVVIM